MTLTRRCRRFAAALLMLSCHRRTEPEAEPKVSVQPPTVVVHDGRVNDVCSSPLPTEQREWFQAFGSEFAVEAGGHLYLLNGVDVTPSQIDDAMKILVPELVRRRSCDANHFVFVRGNFDACGGHMDGDLLKALGSSAKLLHCFEPNSSDEIVDACLSNRIPQDRCRFWAAPLKDRPRCGAARIDEKRARKLNRLLIQTGLVPADSQACLEGVGSGATTPSVQDENEMDESLRPTPEDRPVVDHREE